jgi:predicted glutamine amidotransferase
MCRMFAYTGESREELLSLVESLSNAAKNDTIRAKVGWKHVSHPDGWGFVVCSDSGTTYQRFAAPMFGDDAISKIPTTTGRIFAIFHARKRTKGPIGEAFSQPFAVETGTGSTYLAHNGSLDMDGLGMNLGLRAETDSQMAARYASSNGIPRAVSILKKFVDSNSALNLL